VSVLLGDGLGGFKTQAAFAIGSNPDAIVTGHFSGDGRTGLAVVNDTNNSDDTVSVLQVNSDGTLQTLETYPVGKNPVALVAGDFNGDGRTDLAVANGFSNDVSVLLQSLNGTFSASETLVTTAQAAPLVADLTGDGVNDALVVNGAGDILWRKGRPQEPGTFDPPVTINLPPGGIKPDRPSRGIVAVDTSQGMVLASVDANDDAISLYAWRGSSFVLIASLPTGSLPAQIATADLNGGGADDLVVRNEGDGTLSVYFNTESESGPTAAPPPLFRPPGDSDHRPWRIGRDPGGYLRCRRDGHRLHQRAYR